MADEKSPFDFLSKLTSKGDIGAAGLGFVIGFVIDVALHLQGLASPGTVSIYGAVGAVGLKNTIHSAWNSIHKKAESPSSYKIETAQNCGKIFLSVVGALPSSIRTSNYGALNFLLTKRCSNE